MKARLWTVFGGLALACCIASATRLVDSPRHRGEQSAEAPGTSRAAPAGARSGQVSDRLGTPDRRSQDEGEPEGFEETYRSAVRRGRETLAERGGEQSAEAPGTSRAAPAGATGSQASGPSACVRESTPAIGEPAMPARHPISVAAGKLVAPVAATGQKERPSPPADDRGPIRLLTPTPDAEVGHKVLLKADVRLPDRGPFVVHFFVDETDLGPACPGKPEKEWNTAGWTPKPYQVRARLYRWDRAAKARGEVVNESLPVQVVVRDQAH